MKSQFKKITAAALAMTMCLPVSAFAADEAATTKTITEATTGGTLTTSFDIYSPKINVSVPLKADVKVNPFNDATNGKITDIYEVASKSIDIMNASIDEGKGIPVNVSVTAKLKTNAKSTDPIIVEYGGITTDNKSTKKKIKLELTQAATSAKAALRKKADGTTPEDAAFDANGVFDLSKWEIDGTDANKADYKSATNKAVITQYGSLLSVDIAAPTSTDYGDATKITPTVGSFAVTGKANTAANWKASDVTVDITYSIVPSPARGLTAATVADAPETTDIDQDLTFTIDDVGEATVTAMALHNDGAKYKDFMIKEETYSTEVNSTDSKDLDVTLKKNTDPMKYLNTAANGCAGKPQDFIIALSDGRKVVTTLTVGTASN